MKPPILSEVEAQGYKVFEQGAYNANIIGVRSPSREANRFDDKIYYIAKDWTGNWFSLCFAATCDPGTYWLNNPTRRTGTAILKPGQYRAAWKIGTHTGYPALQQCGRVLLYRDRNRDNILDLDPSTIETKDQYINIHHAGKDSQFVNKWSAGCQVIANLKEWNVFWSLILLSASIWGEKFTYCLLEE